MRNFDLSKFNTRLTGCSSVLALLACAGGAMAQDVPVDEGPSSVDEIVVTASRIDRAGFEAPTPTVRLTAEDLSVGARPNIAAALNDMPQFRATSSPQTTGTNTGAGNAPVDLRGLGISRTLVLIDGRRVSSENDLNSIPSDSGAQRGCGHWRRFGGLGLGRRRGRGQHRYRSSVHRRQDRRGIRHLLLRRRGAEAF